MTTRYKILLLIVFFAATYRTASAQSPMYFATTNVVLKTSGYVTETEAPVNTDISKPQQRKQLMAYLQHIESGDIQYNPAKTKRLYYLAGLFTKLRLYPLAMKCFFKTMGTAVDSISTDNLPITKSDDSLLVKQQTLLGADTDKEIVSKQITSEAIAETFNDGKTAVAYAMIFHVKQPVRGKPKVFKLIYTGHTFITLIKYNSDSTYAAISFGFYPKKKNLLSATPLMPSTTSVFKDDSEHSWDEVLGKFISKHRFNKILALTQQYHNIAYHLSKNNCTDFGLKAAELAGLDVWGTKGNWPLGSGNNPGSTGQSLLEGKFDNADTGDQKGLLITNKN